jgi:hypothetical protein
MSLPTPSATAAYQLTTPKGLVMSISSALESSDYDVLAQIMTGPHGQKLTPQTPAHLLVVFSCADPEVGRAAAHLHAEKLVKRVIFSGRVGKDSGGLPMLGITEAVFLASVAIAEGLPADVITLEQEARNGAENAALSLRLAAKLDLLPDGARVAGLSPAPRCRRLYEELKYQAEIGGFSVEVVSGLPSGIADSHDPQVREELVRELRGLTMMHGGDTPRIHPQAQFESGGVYRELVERAGFR